MNPFRIFGKRQKFLLLEAQRGRFTGALFELDEEGALTRRRSWSPSGRPKAFRRMNGSAPKAIIAGDASSAYTVTVPLILKREHPRDALTMIELENLLAQALGKVFNRYREEASETLGINDLDTVLADSRIRHFTVDRRHVINPLGIPAMELRAVAELVFTRRDVLEQVKGFLNGKEDFFFTERGKAELSILERMEPFPQFLMIERDSAPFLATRAGAIGPMLVRGTIAWTADAFSELIARDWNVRSPVAQELYRRCLEGGISEKTGKYFKKLWAPAVESLFSKLAHAGLKGNVYVEQSVPFPFSLPARKKGITLREPPLEAAAAKFGVTLNQNRRTGTYTFRQLAPFFEFYYDKSDSGLNRWLRRRLHWLGSAN